MDLFMRLFKEEEGQGLIEYALIIGLISLVIIFAGPKIGDAIKNIFTKIQDALTTAGTEPTP